MYIDNKIAIKYGKLNNVKLDDYIIKNKEKNPQRFYRTFCSKCGKDRGYIEPKNFIKRCMACSKKKHSETIFNVNYQDFIKEKSKPIKYRMNCYECGEDKGYKPIAYHDRRCKKCSNLFVSILKTKNTENHRRVKHAFSVCLNERLKKRNSSKSGNSAFEILGYTFEELKSHLESQFESWMTWENYGICRNDIRTWNIDHIMPDSSFTYESILDQGFKNSWSLSNLRPYDSKMNILKSDNITQV